MMDLSGKTLKVIDDGQLDRILFEDVTDRDPSGEYILLTCEGYDTPMGGIVEMHAVELVPKKSRG